MNNMIATFLNVLMRPWPTLAGLKAQGAQVTLKPAMLFIVVMGLLSGVISALWGVALPPAPVAAGQLGRWSALLAIPLVPVLTFVLSFIGTFVLWGLVEGFLRGSMVGYKTMYRIFALLAAFSPVSALVSPIPTVGPWLGLAINIWGIIVLIRGIIIVMDTPSTRTWTVLGLIFLFLLALGFVFRAETQRQLQSGAAFPELGGGAFGDDLGDDEALNRELEALANQAKEAAKNPGAKN